VGTYYAVAWYTDVLIVAGAIVTIGAAATYLTSWGRTGMRAVVAIARRRSEQRAIGPAGEESTEPSNAQVLVLNAVHEHVRAYGRRPLFRVLDKQLDLEGVTLRPLAESMPSGLLLPDVSSRGGLFREDDELLVARDGLRYCEHGGAALDLLARSLAYLAKREKPFVPTAEQPQLQVTSNEIAGALRLHANEIALVRLMIGEYERQTWTQFAGDEGGSWSMSLASEYLRRFRGVRDGAQYLRARNGESFEHQPAEKEDEAAADEPPHSQSSRTE
jgi:hypothetical protein